MQISSFSIYLNDKTENDNTADYQDSIVYISNYPAKTAIKSVQNRHISGRPKFICLYLRENY